MSANCIFCKIVAGKIPSAKVYEDADVLAFMDIGPIVKGHTLVIPKQHFDPITATPEPVLAKLVAVVKKIAQAQMNGLRAEGVNVMQMNGAAAGQVVPHIHFHVIPRFATDGHRWNWAAKQYDDPNEMKQLAATVQAALK
ncbi:MAG: HIT family protein [Verrucomicrobia bacterium]|nr:MAG: HIT family protein [Verrucomicrobiota bacterium]